MLSACSSLLTISFDQLQAGDVSFPDEVRRVAVLNNMPATTFRESGELIDCKAATEALAVNIANVQYFDEVIICDSTLRADDDTLQAERLLTVEEVQRLSDELGADMLFSFDRVQAYSWKGVRFHTFSGLMTEEIAMEEAVETSLLPVVRAYMPGREKAVFTIAKRDTIIWEDVTSLTSEALVKEAVGYAAAIPVECLLPYWEEVTRFYYDGGCVEMRDAAVFLREDNWEEAYPLWKSLYDKKKKGRKKMQAAFNIALYHEIRDEVGQAREWLEKARQLVSPASEEEALMIIYAAQLEEREEKLTHLRIQMRRFDEKF